MRFGATIRSWSGAAAPISASANFFRSRNRRASSSLAALSSAHNVRESTAMVKFVSFVAAWLLAAPAFAQIDCNAGMEPVDASADFSLTAREYIKVIVANEHAFVKALGNQGYAVDIAVETLKGDTV